MKTHQSARSNSFVYICFCLSCTMEIVCTAGQNSEGSAALGLGRSRGQSSLRRLRRTNANNSFPLPRCVVDSTQRSRAAPPRAPQQEFLHGEALSAQGRAGHTQSPQVFPILNFGNYFGAGNSHQSSGWFVWSSSLKAEGRVIQNFTTGWVSSIKTSSLILAMASSTFLSPSSAE